MVDATTLSERYRLGDRIAMGGMGSVWAATDERLGRQVAVKLLKEELAEDPRFVERFRREARAVAALGHPNIANVFDYGEDHGRHFIVMELVDGRDLARLLHDEGKLSSERALHIAAQACDALGHAHAAGVVHRDVKPGNIIVAADDRVKVTDFGIARAVGDTTLTATGSVLGTANYLSPEQASGTLVGPQSDVYSMGILLYEMLTGAVPFSGDSPIAIAMRHVSDPVPPPSMENADVPKEVDALVARATAKEPSDRYRDGAEMAAALSAAAGLSPDAALGAALAPTATMGGSTEVMTGTPGTEQMPPTVWPIPGDRWDPHRLGRIVLMALGALLAIAALLLVFRLFSGEDDPSARSGTNGGQQQQEPRTEPETVTLTSYEGRPADEVTVELEEAGLTVTEEPLASEEEEGIVVDQDPAAGTPVEPDGSVTLFVSTGEEEAGEENGNSGEGGDQPGKAKGHDKGKDEGDD